MHSHDRFPHRSRRFGARRGFTLIELLVVIIIISILMALLLPVIAGIRRSMQEARVIAEISQLETAIASFKAKYGVEPPSQVVLFETGWTTPQADPATEKARVRSLGIIRRIWPQFNFAATRDINGNGSMTDVVAISHSECLVFFLAGPPTGPGALSPIGFSRNALDPFDRVATSREASLFEFAPGRLDDSDSDGMGELRDPLPDQTMQYVYVSSYEGRGYRASEIAESGMLDVYRTNTSGTAWKPNGFQIISSGFDESFGTGGVFTVDGADTQLTGIRSVERDNLTNLNEGRLGP